MSRFVWTWGRVAAAFAAANWDPNKVLVVCGHTDVTFLPKQSIEVLHLNP